MSIDLSTSPNSRGVLFCSNSGPSAESTATTTSASCVGFASGSVTAWPTLVLVDPASRVVATTSGEIDADRLAAELAPRLEASRRDGSLDETPWSWSATPRTLPVGELAFPAKLAVGEGGQIFVADTAHHRVLELSVDGRHGRGRVLRAFGSGAPGLEDGASDRARFHHPHGLARLGDTLLVADTDNHTLRRIDLADGTVSTVAGTGALARSLGRGGRRATEIALRSPWALLAVEDAVLVAMAGSHQIWVLLPDGGLGVFAGSGGEALVDGPVDRASFNQPSDLAFGWGMLFVADAEASAIRALSFDGEPRVHTLVGQGLFTWGDVDGLGPAVRLQHPTGLATGPDLLFVADTYNHKIKTLDPRTGRVETLFGRGKAGTTTGAFEMSELCEPEGVAWDGERLWVADTGNHRLVVADLEQRRTVALAITHAGASR